MTTTTPTERSVYMTDWQVRATLERNKTQHRVPVRPLRPVKNEKYDCQRGMQLCFTCDDFGCGDNLAIPRSPFGVPGDRLWVKETWAHPISGCEDQGGVTYRADHLDPHGDGPEHPIKWKPSIHMPRWASRILLDVKRVWVDRLHAISNEDIQAEGVWYDRTYYRSVVHPIKGCDKCWATPTIAIQQLWDSTYAKRGFGWDTNPWVFACEFERANEGK